MTWDAFSFRTRTLYTGLLANQVAALADAGDLEPRDLVRPAGSATWHRLDNLLNRFPAIVSHGKETAHEHESLDPATDMTPMIDMTFLLLIFFMLTASFHIQKAIPLPAERDASARIPTIRELAREAIVVRIAADGTLALVENGKQRPIEPERLADTLEHEARRRGTATLIIDAADDAKHEMLVRVLDAAHHASLEDVRLTMRATANTRPSPEAPAKASER